ncbi:flagellar brake domain-containing protein [Candidatus Poribacteria bacterium]|nr:flagellar brake domain-containing protein [Candidatus Poribacteria bacterium]
MNANKVSEVTAILSNACERNLPLSLRVVGDGMTEEHHSRFLLLEETKGGGIIIIEAPTSKGSVVLMRPGQEVRVSFSHNRQKRIFSSQLLGRGKVKLNSGTAVPSLELLAPTHLPSNERRGFYRVFVNHGSPIPVSLGVLADRNGPASRVRTREKGFLTDIGGGGLGFRVAEGKSLLLSVGVHVLISFKLPENGQKINLMGRVCFSLRRTDLREVFFGVQFVSVDSEVEYKQGVDSILRFAATRQRESLSKRIEGGH